MPTSRNCTAIFPLHIAGNPQLGRSHPGLLQRALTAGLLATMLIAALPAQAATQIYKWKDKNGVTAYSQKAPTDPSVRDLQTIEIESLPVEQQRAANRMMSDLRRQSEARTDAMRSRNEAADKHVETALDLLALAEGALEAGSAPTAEDRIGLADGGSRLTPAYFERVARLKANVTKARQNLEEVYATRYTR